MANGSNANGTITSTTAVALSTSGGGLVLIWILRCFEAGHVEVPSAEVAMTMVAFVAPVLHASINALVAIISRFGGANGNGNGADHPPAQPIQGGAS